MAKTMFVNPSRKSRKRRRRSAKRRVARPVARTQRRTRRRRSSGRRRRRNAGIAPFVANPMIMANPRRRSSIRRRKNPEFKLKPMLVNTGLALSGSGVGALTNIIGIRRITNMWLRNGVRVVGAGIAAAGFQNSFGGAAAGALLYPMWAEVALMTGLVSEATSTEADINEIAADLEDVLDSVDSDYDDDGGIFE